MQHIPLATFVLVTAISSLADSASGRVYRIVRPASYYDSWRQKRQSHPLATQVRIPEVAFSGETGEGTDGGGGPPLVRQDQPGPPQQELTDYLTPPPPERSLPSQQQQDGKWNLGFDANEILVPPSELARGYDTLKLFTLVPSSAVAPESDQGFENAIQSILEQTQDNSPAGSNIHGDFDLERQPQPDSRPSRHPPGPVYTYVKTDRHGHFKWGVRHGQ